MLAACAAPSPPVRGFGAADTADLDKIVSDRDAYKRVQLKSVEPHGNYNLSFVEFDSNGLAYGEQVESAAESIRRASGKKSVIVLFVHGWGYSAGAFDPHVIAFREVLSRLASDLRKSDRSVVGIYVGWPAKRLKKPLHFMTFLGRDRAVNRISGSHDAERVLGRFQEMVEKQRLAGNDVVSVAIGHSLGGKFLFAPMEKLLKQKALWPKSPNELPLFGDLVLLLNPAQDTNDFKYFADYSGTLAESDHSVPVVAVFSSEADMVIGRTYRIGRTIRTLGRQSKWRVLRSESVGLGWNHEQITHTLCLVEPSRRPGRACNASLWPKPLEVTIYDKTELRRYSDRGPFIVVRVDGHIVTNHGDMFNETFTSFLRSFIADNAGKTLARLRNSPESSQ
jgi:hypothetical protein